MVGEVGRVGSLGELGREVEMVTPWGEGCGGRGLLLGRLELEKEWEYVLLEGGCGWCEVGWGPEG